MHNWLPAVRLLRKDSDWLDWKAADMGKTLSTVRQPGKKRSSQECTGG